MTIFVDTLAPPKNRDGRACTCGGAALGFPQHEIGCGTPVVEPDATRCCGWTGGICDGCDRDLRSRNAS